MVNRIINFVFIIFFTRLLNVSSCFLSIFLVSHYGKNAIASACIAQLSINIIVAINLNIMQPLSISIRQYQGQNKKSNEINNLIKNAFCIGMFSGVITSIIVWNLSKILIYFKQDLQIIDLCKNYFHYASLTIIPSTLVTIFLQINFGLGLLKIIFFIELFGFFLRSTFNYFFINGLFLCPQMGISGIAFADLMTTCVILVVFFLYFTQSAHYESINLFKTSSENGFLKKYNYLSFLNLGVPFALQTIIEFGALTLSIFFMNQYGLNALTALQVTNQYLMISILLNFGFMHALTLFIRETLYQDPSRIGGWIKKFMHLVFMVNFPFVLFFFTKSNLLLSLFFNLKDLDPVFLKYCDVFFKFNGIVLILDGARSILIGLLRGLNDIKFPLFSGVISLWLVGIPISFFNLYFQTGPSALRFGLVIGFTTWIVIMLFRIKKIYYKSISFTPITWY